MKQTSGIREEEGFQMTFHGPAVYASEQLLKVINILATDPGDVRSRLLAAHESFHPLTPDHFPEHLREDFSWVMAQLTTQQPQLDHEGNVRKGRVQVSLGRIRNSTGAKIAQRLLALHYAVDAYVDSRGNL
jgi:hypothetical protein